MNENNEIKVLEDLLKESKQINNVLNEFKISFEGFKNSLTHSGGQGGSSLLSDSLSILLGLSQIRKSTALKNLKTWSSAIGPLALIPAVIAGTTSLVFESSKKEIKAHAQLLDELKLRWDNLSEGPQKYSELIAIQEGYNSLLDEQYNLLQKSEDGLLSMTEANILGELTKQINDHRSVINDVAREVEFYQLNQILGNEDMIDSYHSLWLETEKYWDDTTGTYEEGTNYILELSKSLGAGLTEDEAEMFRTLFDTASQNGTLIGDEYIIRLKEAFGNGTLVDEMNEIMNELNEEAKNRTIKLKAEADIKSVRVSAGVQAVSSVTRVLSALGYADGGFPNVGQLFIANEPGNPELIGNIGGRTAVVNNKMILDGIEASMFNGIVRGMQEAQAYQGNHGTNITEVYLDGELIDRRIKKANEKQLLRVGKPIYLK